MGTVRTCTGPRTFEFRLYQRTKQPEPELFIALSVPRQPKARPTLSRPSEPLRVVHQLIPAATGRWSLPVAGITHELFGSTPLVRI